MRACVRACVCVSVVLYNVGADWLIELKLEPMITRERNVCRSFREDMLSVFQYL